MCAFLAIFSNFPLLLPAVHYVLTFVHAGRMDQWTIYDMGVMGNGPHGSHTTWAKRSTFVKALAQSECGQFYHFVMCGPNWDRHHAKGHADLWEPRAWESLFNSRWITYGMADLISKPAWRYTIGSTPNFGSFRAAKMTPFWDPNFPLPCGQLAAPFL